MSAGFFSTALTVALGSGLALGAMFTQRASGKIAVSPEVQTILNREIERRLDLVVNGSAGQGSAVSGLREGSPDDPDPRDSMVKPRTLTALAGLGILGGLLVALRSRVRALAARSLATP